MASSLKSVAVLEQTQLYLSTDAGKELAAKIGLVYQLNIAPKVIGVDEQIYIVDLKQGKITKGPYDGNPDAAFSFTDSDFLAIVSGKLNPRIAYIRGAIKMKGSLAAAQKFTLEKTSSPSLRSSKMQQKELILNEFNNIKEQSIICDQLIVMNI